ncbi:Regulatory protein cys-3 [Lachnellula suecica]|uniref:Regulatory protein cys-3 n=1 Tax=Lachnellula suecica TaxID=602035 RepID=A0A8T9BXU8_9HELO|nr:Regulatory protein cys-3 [Lachnellula suecica]
MAYNGRRGPNVSEYIANLNAIPTAQDIENSQENLNFDDDLAMFTNTQFFDFDLGQSADLQGANFGVDGPGQTDAAEGEHMKSLDFDLPAGQSCLYLCPPHASTTVPLFPLRPLVLNQDCVGNHADHVTMGGTGDFTFPDFNNFTAPSTFGPDGVTPAPIQTNQPLYPASSVGSPPDSSSGPQPGQKRKADSISPSGSVPDFEEASRNAAEEDKRRRNTAASARFRVKKKQREQALERSAKEMSDKVAALEGRINQLETENKWLKNLITEKNESKEDIAALWKKYNQENSERKGSERKDGVGTKA